MNLHTKELSTFPRGLVKRSEEKAPDPYALPAHQLQAIHRVQGITLIRLIKAWARSEGRRDEDIFELFSDTNPTWPWDSEEELMHRTEEVQARKINALPS